MSEKTSCDQCGGEYVRINQHWSMSSCSHPDGQSSKREYTCSNCGNVFQDYPTRRDPDSRSRSRFFCDRSCKNEFDRDDIVESKCSYCGSDIELPEWRFDDVGGYSIDNVFCDKNCESQWKSREWRGKAHPSYNGGPIDRVKGNDWEQKRADVLDRSDGRCQMCGQTNEDHIKRVGRGLAVHHVRPVRSFETARDAHENNEFLALCVQCHNQAERFSPLRPRVDMFR